MAYCKGNYQFFIMKRTRNRINDVKKHVKSETKSTIKSLNGSIEKIERDYELVFKVKKSHLY